MAKYKVGDKVRIVSERPSSCGFADSMCKYLGTVMTIDKVLESNKPSYKMKEDKGRFGLLLPRSLLRDIDDGWFWWEEWISGLAEEPKESKETHSEPISVHIRFCGALTVAELVKGGKVVKVANAKCNPKDTYDRGEGAKVAVDRLFEKKKGLGFNPVRSTLSSGDAFVVACDVAPFPKGSVVYLIMECDDGCNLYMDSKSEAHFMSKLKVRPYEEAKK